MLRDLMAFKRTKHFNTDFEENEKIASLCFYYIPPVLDFVEQGLNVQAYDLGENLISWVIAAHYSRAVVYYGN